MSESIWVRPPRQSRARGGQTLSREQIGAAAVRLADAGGLEAVTMRSVADELGTTPMALYWYVDTKDHILELMIEMAFREQHPPRGKDWRAVLRSLARGNRKRFAAHPWLKHTGGGRRQLVPSPAQLLLYEGSMRALTAQRPELTAAQLSTVIALINHVVAGHATVPWPGVLTKGARDPAVRDYLAAQVLDGRHPTMAAYLDDFPAFTTDRFDAEIDHVIEGLASLFE